MDDQREESIDLSAIEVTITTIRLIIREVE